MGYTWNFKVVFALLFVSYCFFAEPVSPDEAACIALQRLNRHSSQKEGGLLKDTPSFAVDREFMFTHEGVKALYLVCMQPEGFAVVAGDWASGSVLAFSREGHFPVDNPPPLLNLILQNWASYIFQVATNFEIKLSVDHKFTWKEIPVAPLISQTYFPERSREKDGAVEVKLGGTMTWGQGSWDKPYNSACPSVSDYTEDFEGDMRLAQDFIWGTDNDYPWAIQLEAGAGDHVAGSDSSFEYSYLLAAVRVAKAGEISFRVKVDAVNPDDRLVFCDGMVQCGDNSRADWGNTGGWITDSVHVKPGGYLFHWDCFGGVKASLDNVSFPPLRPVTGCVPLAMAQILAYYKYPAKSNLPSGLPYDWENVIVELSPDSSEPEKKAVSSLIVDCGVSVDADWGIYKTSAVIQNVPAALTNVFDCTNSGIKKMQDYSTNQWYSFIRDDIDAARPVFYCFSGSRSEIKNTHACIVEGYSEEGNEFKIYINFGWDGQGQGWYALAPDIVVDDPVTGIDWNLEHFACFEIVPSGSVLKLLSPEGDSVEKKQYDTGQICPIEWTSRGRADEAVKIEISRDGGETWQLIELVIENTGFYNWEVAGPVSKECLIRISLPDVQPEIFVKSSEFEIFSSVPFIRGDPNSDGTVDISDVVSLLSYLFGGGMTPACMDSADANDDEAVDLSDAVRVLSYLFSGGGDLAQPFGQCGPDGIAVSGDSQLSCYNYAADLCGNSE